MHSTRPISTRSFVLAFVGLACLYMGPNCNGGGGAKLFVESPAYGAFVTGTSVVLSGSVSGVNPTNTTVTVNGVAVPVDPFANWSTTVALDPDAVVQTYFVEMIASGGVINRRRYHTLLRGDSVAAGTHSPESVSIRIQDTGLAQIGPIVEDLSSGSLDISSIITDQNPILDDECVAYLGNFCAYEATANAVEVGFGGFGFSADANGPGALDATITIDDFFIEIDLEVRDQALLTFSCTLEIEADTITLDGTYDLEPDATDPTFADVNLVSPMDFQLSGFQSTFVSGICDDPVLGDIVGLLASPAQLEGLVSDGFAANLSDPDGPGPLDSPIAGAIQQALAEISIAGPVGEAIGVDLDAPLSRIDEDAAGVELVADASFTNPTPLAGTPDLDASYATNSPVPTVGPTTPELGLPYGIALGISDDALNQLLRSQIEGGLLRSDITEVPFGGLIKPLDGAFMSLFIPEITQTYAQSDLFVIEIRPKLAPVMTPGPVGSDDPAEMHVGGLIVTFRPIASPATRVLELGVKARLPVDLAFSAGALAFTLGTPSVDDIGIEILFNPLLTNEAPLLNLLPLLFTEALPALADELGAFPIPQFLGLDLAPVEVARIGGSIVLFANLDTVPTTVLENVVITDLSSGDSQSGGGCWIDEWRHRLSSFSTAKAINVNLRGMLGSDAGCTTNDHSRSATGRYKVNFDVVGVAGEQWTLDFDHAINGALTLISDGYNDGFGFQDGGGSATVSSPVLASWSVAGGASGSFDASVGSNSISDGIGGSSSTINQGFSGSAATSLVGTGNASVELEFQIPLSTFSNSNTAFPTANGDELAIRLGKNDTIDSNFTAGAYPGIGSRNIADDGHFAGVVLTTAPLP